MNFKKIIQRRIRHSAHGSDVAADINAVVAGNVGGRGAVTHVSSTQSVQTKQSRTPRRKED